MKNKLFKIINNIYEKLYCFILNLTYKILARRKCKNVVNISNEEKKSIRKYWKEVFGKRVPLIEYKWYKTKGITISPKLIPDTIWHSKIEPHFSDLQKLKGFDDKNYYDVILGDNKSPYIYLRIIKGQIFDHDFNIMTIEEAVEYLKKQECEEMICKPSVDSCGGRGIIFISNKNVSIDELKSLSSDRGNWTIQELVKQDEFMSKFNETSLNTIRVLSLLRNGEVHILSAFLRAGEKGSRVDNLSSGGHAIQINLDGTIGKKVVDHNRNEVNATETIGEMIGQTIPCWDEIKSMIQKNHCKLAHFQIVNWDIAIRQNNTPVIIEYNLIESSVSAHQIYDYPIFGELTDEILEEVKKEKK